jgi:hypothetical protein
MAEGEELYSNALSQNFERFRISLLPVPSSTALGARTSPSTGSSHVPLYFALTNGTRVVHDVRSKLPAASKLISTGRP